MARLSQVVGHIDMEKKQHSVGQAEPGLRGAVPRALVAWLAMAIAALILAGSVAAQDRQPDPDWYVPTATFTFTRTNTPTCVPTPVSGVAYQQRVNAGGEAYSDSGGNPWSADVRFAPCGAIFGWTTGQTSTVANAIANTPDPLLYRYQRYGSAFGYRFLVPNGEYQVTLGFAETYFSGAGLRRFNVAINGETRMTSLDVFAAAGGANRAYTQTLTVNVSNGLLSIDFTAATGAAIVSTLHVRQLTSSAPTATATPTASSTAQATATATASSTPQSTATASATRTPSSTATRTWTLTPTATFTPSHTPTRTFTPSRTATPTATPPPLDPNEPNDSYNQATTAAAGQVYNGYLQTANDADYYALNVPSAQVYIIARLSNLPADFDLFLEDANGTRLAGAAQRGLNNESIILRVAQAGRYYLMVTGFDHAWSATQAYYLSIDTSPPAAVPANGDQYEPNDTLATASLLPGSGVYTATIHLSTDSDWYALQVGAPNVHLTARLTGLPADYDLLLFQGEDQMPIDWSQTRGLYDEIVSAQPLVGRYELLVQSYDRAASASPYRLEVSLAAATATATASRTSTRTQTPSVTPTVPPGSTATATATATPTGQARPFTVWLPIMIRE